LVGFAVVTFFAGIDDAVATLQGAVGAAGAGRRAVGTAVVALLGRARHAVATERGERAVGVAAAMAAIVDAVVARFTERAVDVAVATVGRGLAVGTAAPHGAAVDDEVRTGVAGLACA